MKTIITGSGDDENNRRISSFVADRCGTPGSKWAGYTTIGLVENDDIVGGVVYHDYTGKNVTAHFAGAPGRRWLNRELLWYGFYYPFVELGCDRITGIVRSDNYDAIRADIKFGFELEAILKRTYSQHIDTLILVMWRSKCRWLKRPTNVIETRAAAAA